MSQPKRDLWGDLDDNSGPGVDSAWWALLREQAELLAEKTDGQLIGLVEIVAAPGRTFRARFIITVPALNGYRYELFQVTQRQLEDFPVEITQGDAALTCNDEDDFAGALAAVLRSDATQKALTRLRQLAREASDSNTGRR
ncbi:MAG: hypothetical protein H6703_04460 [Myxococcales bacterium]|nr:hypothetical protein [Myxococcales bacterium]MCB9552694.1 hypothetical protein [Myxococcales bacterium]